MATSPGTLILNSKQFSDLLNRLQENLSRATDKNDALLEALETAESRALDFSTSEMTLLRNLRARLAATHVPNAALKKDLPLFNGLFQKRFNDVDVTLKTYSELNITLQQDAKDLEERLKYLDKEKERFEGEKEKWRRDIEQARNEITEQNDRLTLLSQQLSGAKNDLDVKTNELANKRIAFEEEKLVRESSDVLVEDGEAESLRRKLRDQTLKNVHLESNLLRTEVSLHQREEDIRGLEERNLRLENEVKQLRMASSKAIKQFERRTKEANMKLSEMNSELSKAQEHAKRFQDLLANERRKQKALQHTIEVGLHHQSKTKGDGLTPAAQKAYLDTLSETLQSSKPHSTMRIDDVVRKQEAVLVENANLKADIRKLRIENTDLLRRVRFADSNAHYMRNQVLTNLHDRAELMRKLDKTEQKYKDLELSITQQTKDWVSQKRDEKFEERNLQLQHIKPIHTLGASERTWNTGPSKTQTLSRSIQVTKW